MRSGTCHFRQVKTDDVSDCLTIDFIRAIESANLGFDALAS
jgi:hypothetical protein